MRKRKTLEKALRQSQRTFPLMVGFAVVGCGALYLLHIAVRLPAWIALVLSGFAVFGAIGDGLNIIYCRRGLRRLDALARSEDGRQL